MGSSTDFANTILIVDDNMSNRELLSDMLEDQYKIVEAENGRRAVEILEAHASEIALVLLDIVMPELDGYQVLDIMNSRHWLEEIPVIMISGESSPDNIERAYDKGITDFVGKPFDRAVIRRRILNTLMLYEKQKRLAGLAINKIHEKEKNSNLMISILSHIVEFRNGESGLHVIHVQKLTEILLRTLMQMTDRYRLTSSDVALISHASALHDIGKISIPDEILNKPGRLTDEEFAIMKTHTKVGADMLEDLTVLTNEPLVKTAYEICRWHHERFDGRGYPDGLVGDRIPISAQIVSLADVYDALTSERVYKRAFDHETAVDMILNGKCGSFNPLLLECLRAADVRLRNLNEEMANNNFYNEVDAITEEAMQQAELSFMKSYFNLIHYEKAWHRFNMENSREILFEYSCTPPFLTFSPHGAELLGVPRNFFDPQNNAAFHKAISAENMQELTAKIHKATPANPDAEITCGFTLNGAVTRKNILCRTMWSVDEQPVRVGVIGRITDADD